MQPVTPLVHCAGASLLSPGWGLKGFTRNKQIKIFVKSIADFNLPLIFIGNLRNTQFNSYPKSYRFSVLQCRLTSRTPVGSQPCCSAELLQPMLVFLVSFSVDEVLLIPRAAKGFWLLLAVTYSSIFLVSRSDFNDDDLRRS